MVHEKEFYLVGHWVSREAVHWADPKGHVSANVKAAMSAVYSVESWVALMVASKVALSAPQMDAQMVATKASH